MSKMNVTFKDPSEILDFVNTVSKYEFDMDMKKGHVVVDAKSLLGIMHLGLNNVIELQMYSEDCEELCEKIAKYAA
ncbi:PTS HPr component phosphorylation site [Lachnoclostridium sp. An169]|uniref:HPr family phosphocarrier protein n=1 Tax=Lachnoclostridium sp. An169 TaxID=1965569 RepID=UPI000B39B2B4|nr:HPr family phosphocarrier protein [Lachnoclostridium sp. An169]OUP81308.1 PTS HPr component phosphorylation site [Lachnoclostridium sp. An169]HJA68199.1 HPr family phosphocarrier protein [Candidatus Mediterraneibacter cottocaccae]